MKTERFYLKVPLNLFVFVFLILVFPPLNASTPKPTSSGNYWVYACSYEDGRYIGMSNKTDPSHSSALSGNILTINEDNEVIVSDLNLIWKITRISPTNIKNAYIQTLDNKFLSGTSANTNLTITTTSNNWAWNNNRFETVQTSNKKTPFCDKCGSGNYHFKCYASSSLGGTGLPKYISLFPVQIIELTASYTVDDLNKILNIPTLKRLDLRQSPTQSIDTFPKVATPPNCLVYTSLPLNLPKNEILNGICANLELSDRITLDIPEQFIAEKASYTRDAWQDGGWETLMLPFDVSETGLPTGYQFDEFSQIDTNKKVAVFNEVTALQAHTPYLMRYASNNTSDSQKPATFTATKVTISPLTPGENEFKGVYQKVNGEGKYILGVKDQQVVFGIGDSTSYIDPFRAYIDQTTATASFQMIHQSIETSTLSPNISEPSLRVIYESSQPRLLLRHPQTVRITSAEGRLLYSAYYDKGEHPLPSLSPGLYFINQTRFIIY